MEKTLVTGHNGFLFTALKPGLSKTHHIVQYEHDVRTVAQKYYNLDNVIHFASASDKYDFSDYKKTCSTIIQGTINMVKIANMNSAKLIFASTMGVYDVKVDDAYCSCKLAMEHYVKSNAEKYLILRIPRVYDKSRKKGLMKSLRLNDVNEHDYSKRITYLELPEFIDQTLHTLNMVQHVYEYDNLINKTIRQISEMYE